MIVFSPARTLSMRQTVVTGRVSDALSGLGIETTDATLKFAYTDAPNPEVTGTLPLKLHAKPAGYFALAMDPGTAWPKFPAGVTVDLTLHVQTDGSGALSDTIAVASDDLELEDRAILLDGVSLTAERIKGAPFTIDLANTPDPIELRGSVLIDNDPDDPHANAALTLDGAAIGDTDAEGRFATTVQPSSVSQVLTIAKPGGGTEAITLHFDFSKPLIQRIFSVPGTT